MLYLRQNHKTHPHYTIPTHKIKRVLVECLLLTLPWFVPTASLVFRKEHAKERKWMKDAISGDYALLLALGVKGDLYYILDAMSIYRIHSGGISSITNAERVSKWFMNSYRLMDIFDLDLNFKYKSDVAKCKQIILDGSINSITLSLPAYGREMEPHKICEQFKNRIDMLLSDLEENQKLELIVEIDIYSKLAVRLVDYGNKSFTAKEYILARRYYLQAIREDCFTFRIGIYLISTYFPYFRNSVASFGVNHNKQELNLSKITTNS